jgi:hypothetical protein
MCSNDSGNWIIASPTVMPAPAPAQYLTTFKDHPLPVDEQEVDFSKGGLYTEEELQVILSRYFEIIFF